MLWYYHAIPCYTTRTSCYRLLQAATGCYGFVPESYRLVHKGGLPHGYHYYRVYISLLTTYLFSRWLENCQQWKSLLKGKPGPELVEVVVVPNCCQCRTSGKMIDDGRQLQFLCQNFQQQPCVHWLSCGFCNCGVLIVDRHHKHTEFDCRPQQVHNLDED